MKRESVLSVLFMLLLFTNLYSQSIDTDKIIRKAGFTKHAVIHKKDTLLFISSPITSKKPTIIFLQGSLPIPLLLVGSDGIGSVLPITMDTIRNRFNIVQISRRGIPLVTTFDEGVNGYKEKNGDLPMDYLISDNLESRVKDLGLVVDYLSHQKWVDKDSIFIMGHSEGYRVAAKYCSGSTKIKKVACLSANPFSRFRDQELDLRKKSMIYDNNFGFDSLCQHTIDSLHTFFNTNWHSPPSNKGDKFALIREHNWLSYLNDIPYTNLLKCNRPILVVYGTKDVNSLDNDLLPYIFAANNKKNLKLKVYPGVGHNFDKVKRNDNDEVISEEPFWHEVSKDVLLWFIEK